MLSELQGTLHMLMGDCVQVNVSYHMYLEKAAEKHQQGQEMHGF